MANKKKVMVIEDNCLLRLKVKQCLEKYGVEVLELNNAEPLFQSSWRYQDLDMLLLDIVLPGMDGLIALEKLHADETWACLPVIILSAKSDINSVQRAIKAGAVSFIRKPFSEEELLLRVRQVLGSPILPENSSKATWKALIHSEVNRAKRGKTSVTFSEIELIDNPQPLSQQETMLMLKAKVKELLREIDSVLINNQNNLQLVLPLTEGEGAKVVLEKIRHIVNKLANSNLKFAIATFPTDGEDVETILKKLINKIQ